MPEFNMETPEQEQALSFDAIRIGLASPEKSENGHMVRLRNLRLSITEH